MGAHRQRMSAPPGFEGGVEWKSFTGVRKNRCACLTWLIKLGQRVEREWDDEVLRLSLIELLCDCLSSLADHAHAELREMAPLATRMLHDLRCDLRHFLSLMLPIERQHSKGLADHQFLVTTDDKTPAAAAEAPAAAEAHK